MQIPNDNPTYYLESTHQNKIRGLLKLHFFSTDLPAVF